MLQRLLPGLLRRRKTPRFHSADKFILAHTFIRGQRSVVSIICPGPFPHPSPPHPLLPPNSNIMDQSEVTHIYPIIRGFEKARIGLLLMLQWGPKSERCYQPRRLGFQSPGNKRQTGPWREGEKEREGGTGVRGGGGRG